MLLQSCGTWGESFKPAAFPLLAPITGIMMLLPDLAIPWNLLGVFIKNAKSEADPKPTGSGALGEALGIRVLNPLCKRLCGE